MSGRWMPPEGFGGSVFTNGQGLDLFWFLIVIGIVIWLAIKP